ncbi:unnamed protein product [Prunus brigantina]
MRLHTCHAKQISNMPLYKLNHSRLHAAGNLQHMAKDKSQHNPSKNQRVLEQNILQTSALHFFLPTALAMEEGRKEGEKRNGGEDLAKLEKTN